jgi:hypothetical protein
MGYVQSPVLNFEIKSNGNGKEEEEIKSSNCIDCL